MKRMVAREGAHGGPHLGRFQAHHAVIQGRQSLLLGAKREPNARQAGQHTKELWEKHGEPASNGQEYVGVVGDER